MFSIGRNSCQVFAARAFTIMALMAATGCASRGSGNVTGRVTFKGKVVASGSVVMAADEGPPATATIESDGSYVCRNVPAGAVRIGVVSPNDALEARERRAQKPGIEGAGDMGKFDPAKWFAIPSKYANYMNSPLTFEVKKGENTFDIDLEP
jgi:hypothetical protein